MTKIVFALVAASLVASAASAAQRIDVTLDRVQQPVTLERSVQNVVLQRKQQVVFMTVCKQYVDLEARVSKKVCGPK